MYLSDSDLWWLTVNFSDGDFKSLGKPTQLNVTKPEECPVEETAPAIKAVTFSCPQEGCTRVFQRHVALGKHLSFEKCTKSVERANLLEYAKVEYAARFPERVGKIPVLPPRAVTTSTIVALNEGWPLKQMKRPYHFIEKKKSCLLDKFNIRQETESKMDPEVVAREMRREKNSNGEHVLQ